MLQRGARDLPLLHLNECLVATAHEADWAILIWRRHATVQLTGLLAMKMHHAQMHCSPQKVLSEWDQQVSLER